MSTVSRGDGFEIRVFEAMKAELNSERLGLHPASCQIYRRKGYRSRDRERDIILDISIEVTLPGASRWSILWAWECKDYTSPVPASDLEEFWAKLQQIGGVNIKGGLVTTSALQGGALRFASSKGIAVVRLLPGDQVEWLIHLAVEFASLDAFEFLTALTNQDFVGTNRQFYAILANNFFDDWHGLLKRCLTANT